MMTRTRRSLGEIRDGSPRQIEWARKIRKRKLLDIDNALRPLTDEERDVLRELRADWVSAQFWIEHRNTPALGILAMLVAARTNQPDDPFEGLA